MLVFGHYYFTACVQWRRHDISTATFGQYMVSEVLKEVISFANARRHLVKPVSKCILPEQK